MEIVRKKNTCAMRYKPIMTTAISILMGHEFYLFVVKYQKNLKCGRRHNSLTMTWLIPQITLSTLSPADSTPIAITEIKTAVLFKDKLSVFLLRCFQKHLIFPSAKSCTNSLLHF